MMELEDPQEFKELWESWVLWAQLESKDHKELLVLREMLDVSAPEDYLDYRDLKDPREQLETPVFRDLKELLDSRVFKEILDLSDQLVILTPALRCTQFNVTRCKPPMESIQPSPLGQSHLES